MKRLIKYLKRNVRLGSMTSTMMLLAILMMSCEPEMCEDCYTYTYSDGTTEWMCIEYDCSDY